MKTVLVTGSSSGFGEKMVHDYLEAGWNVIATLRNADGRQDLFPKHTNLTLKELDITKKEDIASIASFIASDFGGKLDVLVNNAGYGLFSSLEDVAETQLRYQMEVNFFGPALLTKALMPALRKSSGKVFNISSIMGRYSSPLGGVYSSSKYALEGLSEGMRFDLSSHGVQICTIQPGGHRTNFVKSVNWGESSFSEHSPYINISHGLKNMMEKLSSRKNAPGAGRVASKVVSLSNSKKIPPYVTVGKDAKMVTIMQFLLPASIYQALMNKTFRRALGY